MEKITNYKKITFDYMKSYIESLELTPEEIAKEKADFKKAATNEKGSYVHITAVRYFCGRYMPELLPEKRQKKESKKPTKILADW